MQTYVIGATNRPDMIDPAMCRPGRLDKMLYVDLPNQEERIKILNTLTKKTPLAKMEQKSDLSCQEYGTKWLQDVAKDFRCEGFSGADLAALVREASVLALREKLKEHRMDMAETFSTPAADLQVKVDSNHFHLALDKVQPSVGLSQRKKYTSLRSRLSGLPGGSGRNIDQIKATGEESKSNEDGSV